MYILDSSRPWSTTQAWHLIKALADAGPDKDNTTGIRYNEIILSPLFASAPDTTLQALEQAELISIISANGRPCAVRPGKPVYAAAFRELTRDKVLSARLDLAVLSELIKAENDGVAKAEEELKLLGTLPRQPGELAERIRWLLGKVKVSQDKIGGWEAEQGKLKGVLGREY